MEDTTTTSGKSAEDSVSPQEHDPRALPIGKQARRSTGEEGRFGRIHQIAELLSFIAIIIGAPAAVIELRNRSAEQQDNAKKERIEAAETVYREVDQRLAQFYRLCIDHPRLDCYSIPRGATKPPLTYDEVIQQKILYSDLTDMLEVVYVEYHPKHEVDREVKKIFEEQWHGWDQYIREFVERPAYRQAWHELDGEYDKEFTDYIHTLIRAQNDLTK